MPSAYAPAMGKSAEQRGTRQAAVGRRGSTARATTSGGAAVDRIALTPKEADVLRLLPTHLTIDGIGRELGMQRSTAKSHVAHLYRKLGAGSRSQAVDRARAARLIPGPDLVTSRPSHPAIGPGRRDSNA